MVTPESSLPPDVGRAFPDDGIGAVLDATRQWCMVWTKVSCPGPAAPSASTAGRVSAPPAAGTHSDPAASLVSADRPQIHRILFNLVRNAAEVMQDMPRSEQLIATASDGKEHIEVGGADMGPDRHRKYARICSRRSSLPKPPALESGCRSAARSWWATAVGCGPRTILPEEPCCGSPCPHQERRYRCDAAVARVRTGP